VDGALDRAKRVAAALGAKLKDLPCAPLLSLGMRDAFVASVEAVRPLAILWGRWGGGLMCQSPPRRAAAGESAGAANRCGLQPRHAYEKRVATRRGMMYPCPSPDPSKGLRALHPRRRVRWGGCGRVCPAVARRAAQRVRLGHRAAISARCRGCGATPPHFSPPLTRQVIRRGSHRFQRLHNGR
jgi:hypothetical protein